MINLSFRKITGEKIQGTFPKENTIKDVQHFLKEKSKNDKNNIYVISTKPNELFCKSNDSIEKVRESGKGKLIFIEMEESDTNKPMIIPPSSAINAFNNFTEINKIDDKHKKFYSKYASATKNVPEDFDDRVNQMAQMGYNIDDCREALRKSDYDVNLAVNNLLNQQNYSSDDDEIDIGSSLLSILRSFGLILEMDYEEEEEEIDYDEEETDDSESDQNNLNENNDVSPKSIQIRPPSMPSSSSPRVKINKNQERICNEISVNVDMPKPLKPPKPPDQLSPVGNQTPFSRPVIIIPRQNRSPRTSFQRNPSRINQLRKIDGL